MIVGIGIGATKIDKRKAQNYNCQSTFLFAIFAFVKKFNIHNFLSIYIFVKTKIIQNFQYQFNISLK